MKHIVIVGATSAIAEQCARLWLVQEPARLVLLARDAGRVARLATDLRVRHPQAAIETVAADFDDAQAIAAQVAAIVAHAPVDIVLIAHGWLPDQTGCQQDIACCRQALLINGVSPLLYAEAFAQHMERAGHGRLALIGSVAGDRGRKSNYIYGAAKGMVARYAEGLQHRFAASGVRVVLVKPGPTATPMTAHMPGQGSMASAAEVALRIVRGVERGQAVVYAPPRWRVIMWVIRHLPAVVFNRLDI
ncbi:MAG: SDR family NAD(P)-dependent oxidoreductase [Betaproteobacteria bacterium]|nr:SDR family NAD(P)-dependent oxidoreductase [Betaproteobacteria bacterium]